MLTRPSTPGGGEASDSRRPLYAHRLEELEMDRDPDSVLFDVAAALRRPEGLEDAPVWVVDLANRRIVRRQTPRTTVVEPIPGVR